MVRLDSDTMEAAPTLSVKDFPIFAPMRSFDFPEEMSPHLAENPDKTDWFMCLWKTGSEGDDVCSYPCGEFSNFLFHLKNSHGVTLRNNIDFCGECQVVFKNRTEGVNHFLEKTLLFEDRTLRLEGEVDNQMNDFLTSMFTEIKRLRKDLLDEILFSEEMPALGESIDIQDQSSGVGRDTCDCSRST